jgi:hypothetical protein
MDYGAQELQLMELEYFLDILSHLNKQRMQELNVRI